MLQKVVDQMKQQQQILGGWPWPKFLLQENCGKGWDFEAIPEWKKYKLNMDISILGGGFEHFYFPPTWEDDLIWLNKISFNRVGLKPPSIGLIIYWSFMSLSQLTRESLVSYQVRISMVKFLLVPFRRQAGGEMDDLHMDERGVSGFFWWLQWECWTFSGNRCGRSDSWRILVVVRLTDGVFLATILCRMAVGSSSWMSWIQSGF